MFLVTGMATVITEISPHREYKPNKALNNDFRELLLAGSPGENIANHWIPVTGHGRNLPPLPN